jgi:hypothetical protein
VPGPLDKKGRKKMPTFAKEKMTLLPSFFVLNEPVALFLQLRSLNEWIATHDK